MAKANVPITQITRAGPLDLAAIETALDVADGAMFQNDGSTELWVRNAGAGAHIVTLVTPQQVAGLAVADHTATVAAGKTALLGPWPTDTFNQQAGADAGKVYVDTDGTKTEVKLVALRR